MCLGKPRVDTAQMTVRESLAEGGRGTPLNTSSPLPPSHPRFLPPAPFLPFDCLVRPEVPARLSAIIKKKKKKEREKNIIQPGRLSNGGNRLMSDWWSMETAEPTSPHFLPLLAECSQESPRALNRVQN